MPFASVLVPERSKEEGTAMSNRAGQQLGNYHLIRLLGQGNFAEVYLG